MTYDDAQRWLSSMGGSFRVAPAGDGGRTLTVAVEVEGTTLTRSRTFDLQREGTPPDRRRRQAFADACAELRGAVAQLEPAGVEQAVQATQMTQMAQVDDVDERAAQNTTGEPTG